MQEAAIETSVEVGETEEDLDIAVAGYFWPLRDHADQVRLHFHSFWHDNEPDKAYPQNLKVALQPPQVEACHLKLCQDEPDMLSALLKQV